jgi:uncharacterized protein YcfJ
MKGLVLAVAICGTVLSTIARADERATIASDSIAKSLAAEATRLAAAQTADAVADRIAWRRVETLKHDAEVVVERMDFSTVAGRVVSTDPTSLVVRDATGVHSIRSVDVHWVRMARHKGSTAGAVVGIAAGGLAGLLIATQYDWGECRCGSALMPIPVGLGVAFGFLGYHAVPHDPELIYFRTRP